MKNELPPFPVDDATLGLIEAALDPRAHGDPEATSSGIWPLLTMLSQLGGSDTDAVEEVVDDGGDGGARIVMMRDQHYHDNDVVAALVAEVRKLRAQRDAVLAYTATIECPNCDHAVDLHDNRYGTCMARIDNDELRMCGCDWTSSVAEDIRDLLPVTPGPSPDASVDGPVAVSEPTAGSGVGADRSEGSETATGGRCDRHGISCCLVCHAQPEEA